MRAALFCDSNRRRRDPVMAIYSLHVKTVSRSAGRSVVASAAYRAAENIADERLGVVWDFTRKYGVLHSEIVAPADAPQWARDRAELWNAAERAEDQSTRRQSATTGRDIIVALPHELSHQQRIAAVQEFAAGLVERYGVTVDFAIHMPDRHSDGRNYHAHVLMTTREIGPDGFGAKTRALDSFTTGPREIEAIRQAWERIGNRALEHAGIEERIDCRSYADRGIDREASVHLGPVASGMERSGEGSDLGDRNRVAQARNAERERIIGDREAASVEIIDLAAERERRAQENELRGAIRSGSLPRVLEALTERRSTFSRGDLNRELAKVIADPAERASFTNRILALPAVVGLKESETAPVSRYTTGSVLAAEARVMRDAAAMAGQSGHGLAAAQTEAALDRHKQVTGERRAAFGELTRAKGLAVLAGEAGTGKSTTLAAVRDAYEAAGYRVVGMSWTNQVVQNLQRDGFREATTVAAELYRLDRGSARWDRHTVLIVDEAGMLSTKHLARVMEEARAAGAKLVLAGDDKQLASIERGGLFGALREKHDGPELHEVVRVSDAEQRRAFNLMHQGEFLPALAIYARQGAIHWSGGQDEARAALVREWGREVAADPDKVRFVFAYTNADVLELNAALREVRKEQGALGGPRVGGDHRLKSADGVAPFAEGDRIQFTGTAVRREDRQAGIVNGGVGTIRAIDGDRVTVALDGKPGVPERVVSFVAGDDYAAGEFDKFRHGYAGTIYKGQGRTLDETYLYHSEHWRNATSYVALTRHRENVTLFVATETASDLGRLARQMARVDDCRAASQFHTQETPQPAGPVDLARRRAQVEEAAARRRLGQAASERETLTKAAPADYAPGGWRRATVEDVAGELSPEYADRVKYGARLRGLIARTEKAMQDREGAARGSERAAELRWWQLNPAQKTLHATGLWHDTDIKRYERNAEHALRRHDQLAVRRGKLAEQLNVNERLAAAALDKIRPEAERILSQRQREAAAARAALAAIREATPDRQYQRERTRGNDRGLGR
jgi:Ti-type conjugative transfer relaxase TraA